VNWRCSGTTAYSRSGSEVWAAGGHGSQGTAGVFRGHEGGEVGGGFLAGFALMGAPMHEEAVGQAGEDAVDVEGIGCTEPALVVAARDIEPGMEARLNVPMAAVEIEPPGGIEAFGWQAGQQRHGFGLLGLDFAPQKRGLGREGEAGLLGSDGSALEDASFEPALVAFAAAGASAAQSAIFALTSGVSSGCWRFREKRLPAVGARGVRYFSERPAGCL